MTPFVAEKGLFTIDEENGSVSLDIHEFQDRALYSEARITIVLKGWRGGFTSISPWWMCDAMKACGPGGNAKHYLCITPTLRGARGGIMGQMESVFCNTLQIGELKQSPVPLIKINKRGEQMLWGHEQRETTEMHFCFAEDSESFAHYTALSIAADELNQKKFKEDSWRTALARMTTTSKEISPVDGRPKGRLFGGTTVYTLNWVEDVWNEYKATIWKAWKELHQEPDPVVRRRLKLEFQQMLYAGRIHSDINIIRFDSTKNPAINPRDIEMARATTQPWKFRQRYCARFTRPAGMIFEEWDAGRHVIDPFDIPSHWKRSAAIDFGSKNFYATFWAHDPETDIHYIYNSYHTSGKSNADRARDMLEMEPRLSWTVAGQRSEGAQRAELMGGGLPSVGPVYHALWPGIEALAAAIKCDKVFVFRDACPGIEEEFRTYSRPVDDRGEVIPDTDPEDKDTYHWLDGARYYATWKFNEIVANTRQTTRAGGTSSRPAPGPVAGVKQISHGLRAGGGVTAYERSRADRYGIGVGKHLDINIG